MICGMEPNHEFDGRAVVLMSGGPDSLAMDAIADRRHEDVYNVFVDFGQPANENEAECAEQISDYYDAPLWRVELEDTVEALHSQGEDVEQYQLEGRLDDEDLTYIPMRYVQILAYAGSVADMVNAEYIYWGIHYEGGLVPDHDAEVGTYMARAFEASTWKDTSYNMVFPFIGHRRPEVLSEVDSWSVPWEYSYSCFRNTSDGSHCGECHSCHSRHKKFGEAGIDDPVDYLSQ